MLHRGCYSGSEGPSGHKTTFYWRSSPASRLTRPLAVLPLVNFISVFQIFPCKPCLVLLQSQVQVERCNKRFLAIPRDNSWLLYSVTDLITPFHFKGCLAADIRREVGHQKRMTQSVLWLMIIVNEYYNIALYMQ